MADSSALHEALRTLAGQTDGDMSERDVENLFLEQGFYAALDYEGTRTDLRSEFTLPDDRRPDYITLDTNEAVTAVYEFKTTGGDLPPHEDQLFHYMDYLRAEYSILTNGEQLRLYRRGGSRATLTVSMEVVTENQPALGFRGPVSTPRWRPRRELPAGADGEVGTPGVAKNT